MEWIVEPQLDAGMRIPAHMRGARRFRARVSVRWETDTKRHRPSLVARAAPAGPRGEPLLMFDVQVLPNMGSSWALAGYEHRTDNNLGRDLIVAQSWLLMPAPDEDLDRAQRQVEKLLRVLEAAGLSQPP